MINESGAVIEECALVPGAVLFLLSFGTITRIQIAGITKSENRLVLEYRFHGTSPLFRRSLASLGIRGHDSHGVMPKLYVSREEAEAYLIDHLVETGELG